MTNHIFDMLLNLSQWDETCGPRPGIWTAKPAGGRTLWGCWWTTANGNFLPDQMKPMMDDYNAEDALYELIDVAAMFYNKKPELSVKADRVISIAKTTNQVHNWYGLARGIIRDARLEPREYVFPHLPPALGGLGGLMSLTSTHVRPGWGDVKSIIETAKRVPVKTKPR